MNSTSAGEGGGSFAAVDAGSFLLGFPGAPGCTTAGAAGSVCCPWAVAPGKRVAMLPARTKLCVRQLGNLLNVFMGMDPGFATHRN